MEQPTTSFEVPETKVDEQILLLKETKYIIQEGSELVPFKPEFSKALYKHATSH